MSGRVVGWAFEVGQPNDLTANQRYVLVALADNANSKGKCWPSPAELIEKTRLGKSSVYRALTRFRELGLMTDEEDDKGRPFYLLQADSHTGNAPTGGIGFPQGEKDSPEGNGSTYKEPSQTVTREIFDFWVETIHGGGKYKLTAERRKAVEARLKQGYTADELREAIVGCSLTPHNMGQNDKREPYNDLELICRTGKNVERFRDTARRKRPSGPKETAGEKQNRLRREAQARREAEA